MCAGWLVCQDEFASRQRPKADTRALNSRPPVDLPSTSLPQESDSPVHCRRYIGRKTGEEAYFDFFAAMAKPDFESEQHPAVVAPALREPPAIRRTSSMGNPGATF